MAKKRLPADKDPGHKMGKHCGYSLQADGRIIPAPTYENEFRSLSEQRRGINDLMKLFTSHCADCLTEIGRRTDQVWERICEDYDLDQETHHISYDGHYITVTPKPAPKPNSSESEPAPHEK